MAGAAVPTGVAEVTEPTSTEAPSDWDDRTTAWMISIVCSASAKEALAGKESGVPAIWSRNARHCQVKASWLPMPTPGASMG